MITDNNRLTVDNAAPWTFAGPSYLAVPAAGAGTSIVTMPAREWAGFGAAASGAAVGTHTRKPAQRNDFGNRPRSTPL